MKEKKIFPASVLNQSLELFIYQTRKSTNILYISVLVLVVSAFVSLFFIKLDVSVKAQGIIKPKGDKVNITSPISGKINFIKFNENEVVEKGDSLFVVLSENITVTKTELMTRKAELESMIRDLKGMCNASGRMRIAPSTEIYKQEYLSYLSQLYDYQQKINIACSDYERNKILYAEQVIAEAEFEKNEFEYHNAITAKESFIRKQNTQWQTIKNQLEVEMRDVTTKLNQIEIQVNEAVVIAPLNGVIHKIANISDNSYIHNSQQIAELSPNGALLAECYVSPKDIGLLKIGMLGRFQIDAFNYNDWGVLDGEVVEIFHDIETDQNKGAYYYKVYCRLNSLNLHLKNGYTGHLKKGMTLYSRFVVTQRTLFQLLYDKVDNWLNPNLPSSDNE